MSPDFIGAFVIGLLGAGHCMGMCGGLGALLTLNHQTNPAVPLLFYNLGRLGSYMVFGAIVGGLTASLSAV
ncbi:sulfite exporter TauE/SafE family protein, partial [Vibrio alginolyticus]